MTDDSLRPGLHEALVTERLSAALGRLDLTRVEPDFADLDAGSASDRVSRHLARVIAGAIDAREGRERVETSAELAEAIVRALVETGIDADILNDIPLAPPRLLRAIRQRNPDGSVRSIDAPLTPLLDTTVLTNAQGEPKVGHELRAETASADAIDVVMAFIRWSGVRPLMEAIRAHCGEGKPFRVLTTVYTNSTEQRALDELRAAGAEIKVSYDTSQTRLHAKAWVFHRESGYSTAYIGSSNLTHSAQVSGVEWNVRVIRRAKPGCGRRRWSRSSRATGRAATSWSTTRPSSPERTAVPDRTRLRSSSARSRSSFDRSRRACSNKSLSRASKGTTAISWSPPPVQERR